MPKNNVRLVETLQDFLEQINRFRAYFSHSLFLYKILVKQQLSRKCKSLLLRFFINFTIEIRLTEDLAVGLGISKVILAGIKRWGIALFRITNPKLYAQTFAVSRKRIFDLSLLTPSDIILYKNIFWNNVTE